MRLKLIYPSKGLGTLCVLFGKTRQAYYEAHWYLNGRMMDEAIILKLVGEIREKLKKVGTRKLIGMLATPLRGHGISIGRDKLYDLLSRHGLLVRRRKRRAVTTDSNHFFRKHPYLVRDIVPDGAEQVWVCDITYLSLESGFCYLSLVTDAYSRKIVGHCLHPTLESLGPIRALMMAVGSRTHCSAKLIHHSDRGIQYCCNEYVGILRTNGILISMTIKGDPYQNAMAERVNGILKDEFGLDSSFASYESASTAVAEAIASYNGLRPHSSCDYLTPESAHLQTGELLKRWKSYPYKKKTGHDQA